MCKQRAQQYRLNYSNPTHTIPLTALNSTRASNSLSLNYNRHSGPNAKHITQEHCPLKAPTTNLIVVDDDNLHNGCHLINGVMKVDKETDVTKEDI